MTPNKELVEKLQNLLDDNDSYIHGYTGTPMINSESVVPKLKLIAEEYAREMIIEKDMEIEALKEQIKDMGKLLREAYKNIPNN